MKDFGDRHCDFGYSDAPAPVRCIPVRMPNGEIWRVALEPTEESCPELIAMMEKQAADFWAVAGVVIKVASKRRQT